MFFVDHASAPEELRQVELGCLVADCEGLIAVRAMQPQNGEQ